MEKPVKPGQKVIIALRRMIVSGDIKDGARVGEIATAAALGVSRMPVRTALRALEQEGLVVKLGARGYAARAPSEMQIAGAIEVRSVLEGLAAQRLAASGLDPATEAALADCLASGDAIFAKGHLVEPDLERFHAYNLAFHAQLLDACGNPAIGHALQRNNHLPLASAAALAFDWNDPVGTYRHLETAHRQHHQVIGAIRAGDGVRAEALMRAHARIATPESGMLERFGIERIQPTVARA